MTEFDEVVQQRRSTRLAIGYPDPAFPANSLVTPRNPVETNVVFLDS